MHDECSSLDRRSTRRRSGGINSSRGVGLGVGNKKTRKLLQYQRASAEPPKADIASGQLDICFVPKADIGLIVAPERKPRTLAGVLLNAVSGIDSSARRARCCP